MPFGRAPQPHDPPPPSARKPHPTLPNPPPACDELIQFDDTSVILTLVRNNGVTISHAAFSQLADHARRHPAVLAPLATRADLPAPIAFELFWFVPAELRRRLVPSLLTVSETLTKSLKIQLGRASC